MKKLILLVFILVCSSSAFSQSATDTVTIGDQVWMTKNLNVDKFRNGDPIPEAKTNEEWIKAGENKQPAWCYYENDPANGEKYGKLYNWYAVNDPRGLAPEGWHVPSEEELQDLFIYLGGRKMAGIALKNDTGWFKKGNGTNESGFSALPGGHRHLDGIFDAAESIGNWWTSSVFKENLFINLYLFHKKRKGMITMVPANAGASVRLIQD
jgi:uncharacterized protein (TIGR02145 family)